MMLESQNVSDFLALGMWSVCSRRALPQHSKKCTSQGQEHISLPESQLAKPKFG